MAIYRLSEAADDFPAGEDVSLDDRIYGLGGDDIVSGGPGGDLFDGGEGIETVSYASATVGIFLNPMSRVPRNDGTGNDLLDAGEKNGGDGDDLIQSGTNSDTIDGSAGIDTIILYGSPSDYRLFAGRRQGFDSAPRAQI